MIRKRVKESFADSGDCRSESGGAVVRTVATTSFLRKGLDQAMLPKRRKGFRFFDTSRISKKV